MVAHFHHSGFYGTRPRVLAQAVPTWTEEYRLGTYTEMRDPDRRRALERALMREGHVLFDGKRDPEKRGPDCAISWVDDNWEAIHRDVVRLLSLDEAARQDNPKALEAPLVVLRERRPPARMEPRRLLVTVAHLPSHVDNGPRGFHDLPRVQDYHRGVDRWSKAIRGARREHRPDGTMVVADWNVHLMQVWFRRYLRRNFPVDLSMAWPKDYRGPGTHRRRVIDGTLTDMVVKDGPEVLVWEGPRDPSDHEDYAERLRFPRTR